MTEYKIVSMNIGFGEKEYTVNRVETHREPLTNKLVTTLKPVIPIRYYKTIAGAEREIKRLKNR